MHTDALVYLLAGVALGGTAVMVIDCIRGDRTQARSEDRVGDAERATQEFYDIVDQAVELVSDHPPTDDAEPVDDGETRDVIARRAALHVVNGSGGLR